MGKQPQYVLWRMRDKRAPRHGKAVRWLHTRMPEELKDAVGAAAKLVGGKMKADSYGESDFCRDAIWIAVLEVEEAVKKDVASGGLGPADLAKAKELLGRLNALPIMSNRMMTSVESVSRVLESGGVRDQRWVVGVGKDVESIRMEMQCVCVVQRRLGELEAFEKAEARETGGTEEEGDLLKARAALLGMLGNMLISTEDVSGMLKPGGRRGVRWVAGVREELKNIRRELQRVRQLDRRLQEMEERWRIEDRKRRERPSAAVRPGTAPAAESSINLA